MEKKEKRAEGGKSDGHKSLTLCGQRFVVHLLPPARIRGWLLQISVSSRVAFQKTCSVSTPALGGEGGIGKETSSRSFTQELGAVNNNAFCFGFTPGAQLTARCSPRRVLGWRATGEPRSFVNR